MGTQEPVPAFCICGRTKGFRRSARTGFWVCDNCGCPREAWWLRHKQQMERRQRRGRCTQGTSLYGNVRRACDAVVRYS